MPPRRRRRDSPPAQIATHTLQRWRAACALSHDSNRQRAEPSLSLDEMRRVADARSAASTHGRTTTPTARAAMVTQSGPTPSQPSASRIPETLRPQRIHTANAARTRETAVPMSCTTSGETPRRDAARECEPQSSCSDAVSEVRMPRARASSSAQRAAFREPNKGLSLVRVMPTRRLTSPSSIGGVCFCFWPEPREQEAQALERHREGDWGARRRGLEHTEMKQAGQSPTRHPRR